MSGNRHRLAVDLTFVQATAPERVDVTFDAGTPVQLALPKDLDRHGAILWERHRKRFGPDKRRRVLVHLGDRLRFLPADMLTHDDALDAPQEKR